jgi:hypothetical protein
VTESACKSSNYCIARMYSGQMACFQHDSELPDKWRIMLGAKRD